MKKILLLLIFIILINFSYATNQPTFELLKHEWTIIESPGNNFNDYIEIKNRGNESIELEIILNESYTSKEAGDWTTFNHPVFITNTFYAKDIKVEINIPPLAEEKNYIITYIIKDKKTGYSEQVIFNIISGDSLLFDKIWYELSRYVVEWQIESCNDFNSTWSEECALEDITYTNMTLKWRGLILILIFTIIGLLMWQKER